MGTWDVGNFGNDYALDWVCELEEAESVEQSIEPALQKILQSDSSEFLDAPDCCEALAAAEVVAMGLGRESADLPEETREWLKTKSMDGVIKLADQAYWTVDRIKTYSELKSLFEESQYYVDWQKVIADLENRLGRFSQPSISS